MKLKIKSNGLPMIIPYYSNYKVSIENHKVR